MGGSGGGSFGYSKPDDMRHKIRQEESRTRGVAFETVLSGLFGELLGAFNARDVELVKQRLDHIKSTLQSEIDGSFDQFFGGSVAKHTYVDGLSDVDSLIVIDDSSLNGKNPASILNKMKEIISGSMGDSVDVSSGRMAITITFSDGMVLQVLPALKGSDGTIRVPSSRNTDSWSRINPLKFQEALTRWNAECGGKLVPTIKLAKAVIGQLPEAQRLSGYHVESLAIAAFRDYNGTKTTAAMLPAFFEKARELVLQPIRDSSGQSVNVDDYLGSANSQARQAASHLLGRLSRRMLNASAAESVEQWKTLFGIEG